MYISADARMVWQTKQEHREARTEAPCPPDDGVWGAWNLQAEEQAQKEGYMSRLSEEIAAGRAWDIHVKYRNYDPARITLCKGMTGRNFRFCIMWRHGVPVENQRLSVHGKQLADAARSAVFRGGAPSHDAPLLPGPTGPSSPRKGFVAASSRQLLGLSQLVKLGTPKDHSCGVEACFVLCLCCSQYLRAETCQSHADSRETCAG